MLRSYLTIAWRNLHRYPGYSIVTVFGLAVGIAGALFVLLYLQDELSFDRYHENADRIYRVVESRKIADGSSELVAYSAGILAPTLVETLPEFEAAVRILGHEAVGRRTVSYGDRRFYEADYLFTEPQIFDVMDFELLRGSAESALRDPHVAVLTESAAVKYFGTENPVGKTLEIEQYGDFRVTGIVQDPPANSHLQFSMLLSLASARVNERWVAWLDGWDNGSFLVYALLRSGTDPEAASEKLNDILRSRVTDDGAARSAYLQSISDIHFDSALIDVERNAREGDVRYLYIFSAIGIFLVLIASINYMNMTTARSMRRAREIGMRKVAGGRRGQLVRQFLAEGVLTTLVAAVIAVALVGTLLPVFNEVAGKEIATTSILHWSFLLPAVGLSLAVGLLAGSYPALYLSRFQPSQILSQSLGGPGSASNLRRGLVVAQFTLSIIMIAATTVVYNQLQYVQSKPLGFNKDHLVVVDINNGDVRRDWQTIRDEFSNVAHVQKVSTSSRVPGDWKGITEIEVRPEGAADDQIVSMHFIGVDDAFLDTYEMDLLDGRPFGARRADSVSVILNETAARMLGIRSADRQTIEVPEAEFRGEVVGIVEDFNFQSLYTPVGPLILGYWSNPIRAIDYFTVRIAAGRLPDVIERLRAVGERFDPSHPFEYNVLEERLDDFYETEKRAAILFGVAAALAIFIACLGLAGLAAYTAERRTKEIGVRKVLGASVRGIIVLLSRDFLILVAIAFVIAGPLAYGAMDRWLDAFAFRTELGLWIFALSGTLALVIALATVSVQAIRSALANPVESLRYE
jgi:putative ABC transport system permease protein